MVVLDEKHRIHLHIHHLLAHVRLEDFGGAVLPFPPEAVHRLASTSNIDAETRPPPSQCRVLGLLVGIEGGHTSQGDNLPLVLTIDTLIHVLMVAKDTSTTVDVAEVHSQAQVPHLDVESPRIAVKVQSLLQRIEPDQAVAPLHVKEKRFSVGSRIDNLGG